MTPAVNSPSGVWPPAPGDTSRPVGDEGIAAGLASLLREHFSTPTTRYHDGPPAAPPSRLINQYCEARALDHAEISRLLGRIRNHASLQPPRSDPDLKRWNDHEPGASGSGS